MCTRGTERYSPLRIGLAFTAISGLLTSLQVHWYYRTHLPHFDSIGSYTTAFSLMDAAVTHGIGHGVAAAAQVSLTWLQPFYALAWSWAPWRSPAVLVSLNFILVALTQCAVAAWCRVQGYGWRHQVCLLVLPLMPGIFYAWDGGLQDWRRDAQMSVLLIGVFFMALTYVTAPTPWRALGLGLLTGLTQLSRDNALSMIAITVLPAIGLAVARTRRWADLIRLGWLPILTFLLCTAPYYGMTLEQTVARYTTSVWGPGEDRLASLARFWSSPFDVLLGGTTAFNGKLAVGVATAGLLVLIVAALFVAARAGLVAIQPGRLGESRARILLGSGVTVLLGVILYNTLGLGYGAQYHGMPFMPVATGLVALFAGLSDAVTTTTPRAQRLMSLATIAALVALLPFNAYRVHAGRFSAVGERAVEAARAASFDIAQAAGGCPVAFHWLSDFSFYHVNYYLAQAGRAPIRKIEERDPRLTIDGPIRTGEPPSIWLERLRAGTKQYASVVVLHQDPTRYSDPRMPPGLFRDGEPFARALLADPDLTIVNEVAIGPHRFTVLRNNSIQCPA